MTSREIKEALPLRTNRIHWALIVPVCFAATVFSQRYGGEFGVFAATSIFIFGGLFLRWPEPLEWPASVKALMLDLLVPVGTILFFFTIVGLGFWEIRPIRPWWIDIAIIAIPEELFFRFGLLGRLRHAGYRAWVAIPFAAGIFVLFHVQIFSDPMWIARVFAGGITFGILYWWRRSLLAPILMHALLNQVT